ncbi:MAG: hypothetical protein ACR2N9_01355 [Acidimicrobiia bacterium]
MHKPALRRCHHRKPLWRAGGTFAALIVTLNLVTAAPADAGGGSGDKITGSVTIAHAGNHSDGELGSAFVTFEAFEKTSKHAARGSLQLAIVNASGEMGRRITVKVTDVWVDGSEGAFLGIVTADVRSSAEAGGHDVGGHDVDGHDVDGHEDEDDHATDHAGGSDHASGRDRTGQLMAISLTDGGAPGRLDTLDWKWFAAGSTISLEDVIEMGSLCDRGPKGILSGNLLVHVAPTGKTKAKPNRSI